VTEHHQYNDVSNQQDAITFSFINLFKSAQHVSGDKFAHPQEHFFDSIYSFWYNAPRLLPIGATVEMELSFINLFKSALHISGDKFGHPQEHFFDSIYSFWYNAPRLLPDRCHG